MYEVFSLFWSIDHVSKVWPPISNKVVFHGTIFNDTFILWSSLNVRDKVSRIYMR